MDDEVPTIDSPVPRHIGVYQSMVPGGADAAEMAETAFGTKDKDPSHEKKKATSATPR